MQRAPVRPVAEGGVLTAVAIIFALISTYVPVIGAFVTLIWPVPIILLGVRHGYNWSVLAVVASGIIISLLMPPLTAIAVIIGYGLIGIVLSYALRSSFSPAKALLLGAAASLISKMAVIGIMAVVMGFNPLIIQTEAMTEAIKQALEFYRSMGMKTEDLAQMEAAMQPMPGILKMILPTCFILAAFIDTYLNFQVVKVVLGRLGQPIKSLPPFRYWSMPPVTVYALALALVALYWGQSREIDLLYTAGMNTLVLSGTVLFIQGMALFYFLADKYKLSKLTRGIILFLIFFSNGIFIQSLIIGGAFDLIFDYRQLRSPRSE